MSEPRPDKQVVLFDVMEALHWKDYEYHVRRVMRDIERMIDKHGQALLVPDNKAGRLV